MSIDYSTPTGQVRLLIADLDEAELLFRDDQVAAFLSLNGDTVKLAAAAALEAIAASEVLISKKIRTQDLATDGPAVAAALRELAKTLRDQAADVDGADIFDIVDTINPTCRPEHTNHPGHYTVWGL